MLTVPDGELTAAISSVVPRPYRRGRWTLDSIIRRQFRTLAALTTTYDLLRFAYSFKTNPKSAILSVAQRSGCDAETISDEELAVARDHGFHGKVFNGPFPAWRCTTEPTIVFADSYEAFSRNAGHLPNTMCGIRLRPAGIESRFGIAHDDPELIERVRASGRESTAVSLHIRPEDYGPYSWRDIVTTIIDAAARIDRQAASVRVFDVGGGWTPESFDEAVRRGDFAWLEKIVARELPSCVRIVAEPGQAVVTPCEVFVAPFLEVRKHAVVIDGGYPDIPQMHAASHRLFIARSDGSIEKLGDGSITIFGRTCLEYDSIPTRVALPIEPSDGDAIMIADCGAYDSSMSFSFARAGQSSGV